LAGSASAAEIKVFISGGFSAAYDTLVPAFERATGHKVVTERGPSMGETPQAIPNRLARGESADVVILVGYALDNLIKKDLVAANSRTDLAWSPIAMAVKAGAPKPDISTVDAFRRALLAAKSIAYSDSASGEYLSTTLFRRIGVYDQIKDKAQDPGRAGRQGRRTRRSRDRLPAGERVASVQGGRHRRADSGRIADRQCVRGRHRQERKAAGGRQGADRVSGFPGREARYRGKRNAVRRREEVTGARRSGAISTPPCHKRALT
jgi:ABC-type molybdate transport system substrate-binding protein